MIGTQHRRRTGGKGGLRTLLVACVATLCACAGPRPAPEVPLDNAVKAEPVADPPRPLEIVEVPQALPLPGQLKPVPDSSSESRATNPLSQAQESQHAQALVSDADAAARMEPSTEGFLNSIQIWPFSPGALYQVYTSPGRVTDLALEAGEDLKDISAPDTVRWVIADTESGEGPTRCVHVAVKPTREGLHSNLTIYTSRRTYFLELTSTATTWMASVSWEYPQDRLLALKNLNREREAAVPVAESVPLDQLKFRYTITGDKPSWRPERAFDDGARVYIQFPSQIAQGEMPPLFVIGPKGEAQLVNYRVRPPYYIVDRLFGAAELRLGADKAETVRITRADLPELGRHRKESR